MATYQRRDVERLIPYIWDDSYAYRATNPMAPDPDMPRGQSSPARSGTMWAAVADVKRAWKASRLTTMERQAILCGSGLGWPRKLTAERIGAVPAMVDTAVYEGVGKMVNFLEDGTI
jgi:hypothetical protein